MRIEKWKMGDEGWEMEMRDGEGEMGMRDGDER